MYLLSIFKNLLSDSAMIADWRAQWGKDLRSGANIGRWYSSTLVALPWWYQGRTGTNNITMTNQQNLANPNHVNTNLARHCIVGISDMWAKSKSRSENPTAGILRL